MSTSGRDGSGAPGRRRRRWLRVVAGLALALGLALRIALPGVIRSQIEQQGTALLAGRLTVGDVDLEVLRGLVALEEVALRADDAGPAEPPIVAADRLWVNLGWLSLARKMVEVEDAGIRGLRIHAERLPDGVLALPGLRETPEETEPAVGSAEAAGGGEVAPEATVDEATPWSVVVRRFAFRRGELRFVDHVADPPETREIMLPSLAVTSVHLQPAPDAGPGRARVRLGLRDGVLEARARVRAVEDGFDLAFAIEATDLPLDRVHVHLPALGWSTSTGRLSGLVTARLAPGTPLVAQGEVEVEDVDIEVPGEEGVALGWKRFAVVVRRADLEARHVDVERVELAGARALVRPSEAPPLRVLAGVLGVAESGDEEPAEGAVPTAEDAGAVEDSEAAPAWSWAVKTVAVTDARATVFLEPPPLDVEVRRLEVTGLSSESGSEAEVDATIGVADGTLVIEGPVTLDPPSGSLAVHAEGVEVGVLAAATDATPVPLVARLDADLDVVAREDPLVVSGRLDLHDVEAKVEDGKEFLVAWKRLALGVERVSVPGLLPFGDAPGAGDVAVAVASVDLEAPRVVMTLTADGLVLPEPSAPDGEPAAGDGPEPGEAGSAFSLVVDRLTVRDGDMRFADETVTPTYRGRLARLSVDARGLRVPGNRVDAVTLSTRVGNKAPIEVKSARRNDEVTVTSTIRDVPLSQFNPYATPWGYRIGQGTLSLDSETTLRPSSYDSENRIDLHRITVTGVEGDALFTETFGIPLSVALALLRDMHGHIVLDVPVSGDERGGGVDVGAVVRDALGDALVGALASPMKLLGAVKLGKGRIEGFEPAPIAFVPGTTNLARESTAQVKQLSRALDQLPALQIRLVGRAGATDARALAERDVLAMLEEDSRVVGGVRNLFSGGTRGTVRDALRARVDGEEGPLDGDAAAQLDAWVAERPVDAGRLRTLAEERAALMERRLREGGARPEQLVVGEARTRQKGGRAEVDVAIADEATDEATE